MNYFHLSNRTPGRNILPILGALLLMTMFTSCASAQLEVDPSGRYFTDDGKHVLLFGGGLWGVISDTNIDIEEHNAWMQRWGLNSNRASLYAFFNAPDVANGQGLAPWKRVGPDLANDGKAEFDLTQFDPAFWKRADEYFASARKHDLYVLLQIFDEPFIEGGEHRWPKNPFNPDNNINNLPDVPGSKTMEGTNFGRGAEDAFYNPDNATLMEIQDTLVRRLLDQTAHYGNIIYEIGNEINMDSASKRDKAWQQHWVDFFKAYEKEKGIKLLLSNDTREDLIDHNRADFGIINHHGSFHVNFTRKPPEQLGRIIFDRLTQDFEKYKKPIINSRPCSDPDRTNYSDIVGERNGRCIFWSYFMGGGHIIGFRTTEESFMGGDTAEHIIRNLRRFIGVTQFWTIIPRADLIQGAAFGMAEPGLQYALYFPIGGQATVDLRDVDRPLYACWFNPRDSKWLPPKDVKGGSIQSFATPDDNDWALYISPRKITE